jgi:hypothetical protein
MMNSMTKSGKLKITKDSSAYYVNGILTGPLLLKLILKKAIIGSRATSANLREHLTTLDAHMATVDCNVELFNKHVKEVVTGLRARGESTDELVVNLFKAYHVVGGSEFSRYMKNKRDAYDDGEDVQTDPLMSVALAKSQSLIEYGVWNMMYPDQEILVALLSEVNMMKERKLKLSKDTQGGRKGKKPEDKGKFKKAPKPSKKKSDEYKWAWNKVPPQSGDPKTKHMSDLKKIITGVMIIKQGLYISQKTVNLDKVTRKTTVHSQPCLQSWDMTLTRSENYGHSPSLYAYRTYSRYGLD